MYFILKQCTQHIFIKGYICEIFDVKIRIVVFSWGSNSDDQAHDKSTATVASLYFKETHIYIYVCVCVWVCVCVGVCGCVCGQCPAE